MEIALVDEAAGFIDDDEGVDSPGFKEANTAWLARTDSLERYILIHGD